MPRLLFILAGLALIGPASSAGGSTSVDRPSLVAAVPGDVVRFDGIGAVVPKPGHEVTAAAVTTTGDISLQILTSSDGRVFEVTKGGVNYGGGDGGGSPECGDTYEPGYAGFKWNTTFRWYFHSDSTPTNNNVDNVETDLKTATANITNENNICGRNDTINATASYAGRLQQSVNISNSAVCLDGNGTSVVGFGTLPSAYVAYTCTYSNNGSGSESDTRLNKSYYWITDQGTGCVSSMNVDNVATHERGHTFGMNDVYDSAHGGLTMYGYISECMKNKETLALGDMLRLEAIY